MHRMALEGTGVRSLRARLSDYPHQGIYARYIDDIFVTVSSDEEVSRLISGMESNSCLTFTSKRSVVGRLPFLDIDISRKGQTFSTIVLTKSTNVGRCLNARGECPAAYKKPSINVQQTADFILPSARPQDRNTPPVQHHLQDEDVPQPGNQLTGPKTRSRNRASGASSLPQDQVDHPLTNHRAPWETSQAMAGQPSQPTRAQLGGLFQQSGPR
ncbi:hypothetical protein Pmani_014190 [Petrolisthes manimaculis]|uniref:Reverse transcriptase domain-containing protein n=1 Tax=Petrolisthes manimaculis TaxID=1843537 RepID=A0AAE1PVS8_9EUCA|nr:hypothetical protein Pmani_014190 [Petrolisthes manimaculis]